MPAHLVPTGVDDDVRAVAVVLDVVTHPFSEGEVGWNEISGVAALGEAFGLFFGRDVEEANVDGIELGGAGGGVEFAGRDGITAEEEMCSGFLVFECDLDGFFNGLMPPAEAPFGSEAEGGEFVGNDAVGEVWF